jgi:anti-sigma B factor antagonist
VTELKIKHFVANDNIAVLDLSGFIDSTNASKLKESIDSCTMKNRYNIVVNFKGVDYVSSAGWGVLIGKIKHIRENKGDLILSGMIESVHSIYKLMELDKIFKSFKSVEEAVTTLRKKEGVAVDSVMEIKEEITEKEEKEAVAGEIDRALSLEEEIRLIIAETPLISHKLLAEKLVQKKHGGWKTSWFQLRSLLRKMDLGTVTKRLYFAFQKAREEK